MVYHLFCLIDINVQRKSLYFSVVCKLQVLLCGAGEDLSMFKKIFSYLVELAECDLNYDVRDRARFVKKLQSCNLVSQGPEERTNCLSEKTFCMWLQNAYLGDKHEK